MLYTVRTPLRVSFFGGGTDYPEYFRRGRGAVLGMAVNKYIYISAFRLLSCLEYRYRLSYSRLEQVGSADEIQHPAVREAFRLYGVTDPLDVSVMADLPANSGLGSSSSFSVGLLNLISHMAGASVTKLDLAQRAIHLEREVLGENVGVQDQLHAAFGGFNRFDLTDNRVRISPLQMTGPCQDRLMQSLFLVYTGVKRHASKILDEQVTATASGSLDRDLSHLLGLVDDATAVLEGRDPVTMLNDFGAMLHEGWLTKRRLSARISSPEIDALYEQARGSGAIGGKLCGAGAGGFLLAVVPPERRGEFLDGMADRQVMPITMDTQGSVVLRQ